MKIPILIFILYIHCSSSQIVEDAKKAANTYPKKVRTGLVQYNNAYKYVKSPTRSPKSKAQKKVSNGYYTAFAKPFPRSDDTKPHHQIIPDSPYFPVDDLKLSDRRSRVKKVLPEYILPARHKRSAYDNNDKQKQLKPSIQSNGKKGDVRIPGQSKVMKPISKIVERGTGKLKKSVKNNDGRSNRLIAAKKRQEVSKKRLYQNTGVRNKNLQEQRIKNSGLQRNKLNRNRPHVGQGRLRKQHKLSPAEMKQKRLKSGRIPQGSKLRYKNLKRRPSRQFNSTSKTQNARYLKDLSGRRLIAARDALIEDYPYSISIQKDGHHWCAGAILNPRLIITTANCLWRSNSVSRMRVRAGSRHTDRGGQTAKIQEVMKHPGWKLRRNPDNDVALALLDKNIRFSHSLHGVDLPNRVMLPPFDDAWITSWGSDRRDGIFDTSSVNLQVYHARLIDREKCNNMTVRFGIPVTENFICLSQSGNRAPCTRDTGAPAVSDGVLWGMASWGIRKMCGTERFPAVFSYLASQTNMDFIVNATHYLMSEERNYPFPDKYPVQRASITTPTLMTLPYKR